MDTPLVKILLIAAAIAITVGVIVLAWGIFNQATAEVEVDGEASALEGGFRGSLASGSKADILRSRITNERACRAAGYQWFDVAISAPGSTGEIRSTADSTSSPPKRGYQQLDENEGDLLPNAVRYVTDHSGTRVNEREAHCANSGGLKDDGGTPRPTIWLYSSSSSDGTSGRDYRRFAVMEP